MLSSSAVLLFALTTFGAYTDAPWATPLFWLALVLIYAPASLRLCSHAPSRFERIGILVMLVTAFYLLKLLHSPHDFTFADEFVHRFNAEAILHNGRLFTPNSVLRVSPLYPGLEIVTAWLVAATGAPLHLAAALLIGAARLILVLGLFLLYEQISRSARVASLGAAVYMAQPNFLFWSAQFSYESLSLPLAIALLVVAGRYSSLAPGTRRRPFMLLFLLVLGALVITHHLTVFALVVVLAAWSLTEWLGLHRLFVRVGERLRRRCVQWGGVWRWAAAWLGAPEDEGELAGKAGRGEQTRTPTADGRPALRGRELALLALVTLLAGLAWLVFVASPTVAYVSPVLRRAFVSIADMLAGAGSGRQLFVSSTGSVAPLWERLVGIGSVLLSLAALPFGLRAVWRRCSTNALAAVLALAAILYFAVLPLRLTGAGWETGNRAAAYLFLGLAFVLGLAVAGFTAQRRTRTGRGRRLALPAGWSRRLAAGGMTVLFLGGVIAGWAPQLRLALPLVVETGGQTFLPQPYGVAAWTRTELPPGRVFVADEVNGRVLLAEGGQYVLTGRQPSVVELLREVEMKDWHLEALIRQEVRYLVVDDRRISWDNMAGYFFDKTEDGVVPPAALFDEEQTGKYDRLPVDRILDSGNIVIYDAEGLYDATPAP